ncbi:MAG TPA: sterol desaturase family protein [Candidatus Limnocylindria bacterium]|jgi:4-hydroxysphinganine ceramide fatty acyl 2-hydroxylase|nr:sterol desaturase family protein [Candidatus Limnocylindria bacterium]
MFETFVRHGSNAVLLVLAGILAVLFGGGALAFVPLAVVVGALVFFVSEYTTHRFLLHARPVRQPFVLGLQHRLHYDHHRDPSDLRLLFLPLWFAVPVVVLYLAVAYAITRAPGTSASALFGAVVALLYYEWVHYVAHVPFVPRTRFGRWIKKYHLLHHFKNERLWFGVTNPSMDVLGGTYRRSDQAPRSISTRILFR